MLKTKESSIDAKSELRRGFDFAKVEKLSERLQDTLEDYILSLHGISEGSTTKIIPRTNLFKTNRSLESGKHTQLERFSMKENKKIEIAVIGIEFQ